MRVVYSFGNKRCIRLAINGTNATSSSNECANSVAIPGFNKNSTDLGLVVAKFKKLKHVVCDRNKSALINNGTILRIAWLVLKSLQSLHWSKPSRGGDVQRSESRRWYYRWRMTMMTMTTTTSFRTKQKDDDDDDESAESAPRRSYLNMATEGEVV